MLNGQTLDSQTVFQIRLSKYDSLILKLIGFPEIHKEQCLDTMNHSLITIDREHKEKIVRNSLS